MVVHSVAVESGETEVLVVSITVVSSEKLVDNIIDVVLVVISNRSSLFIQIMSLGQYSESRYR